MEEDKQKICDLLLPAIQATRGGSTVEGLEYDPKQDVVFIHTKHGVRVANTECDSGISMIRDIMRQFG
ncbi:MAG: hypothetical protein LUC17_00675 [Oscillospiraceae bacterium]|nr:hypothetical protein [Oscillospiraceae bacterium]